MMHRKPLLLTAAFAGLALIAGCQSNDNTPAHLTAQMYHGTLLDRHEIGVTQHKEYLEVQLDARDAQLRISEVMKVRDFLHQYVDVGHGPLIISMPQSAENPQLAVGAVAEIREFAWEAGIGYEAMLGAAYDASVREQTPIVMAFKTYKAVAPQCKSLAQIDMANAETNTDLPTLGCAVRTNMAAMIAEPADLLGQRDLSEGDLLRRSTQLDLWRQGQPTPAARADSETTAISTAVQ